MKECLCGHSDEDHVTGLCLATLDCICPGYKERQTKQGEYPCRRCNICDGLPHHWLEHIEDAEEPSYTHHCKHCAALGMLCDDCENAYGEEEDCDTCEKVGVVFVRYAEDDEEDD